MHILTTDQRPTDDRPLISKNSNGHISATDHLMFASRVGFSGMADLMTRFPVRTNPRSRRPPSWKNFKWPYLRNRSSDPLHMFVSRVVFFTDGGSNGAISGSNKSTMEAAAILEKFHMATSTQRVVRSTSCFALKFTPSCCSLQCSMSTCSIKCCFSSLDSHGCSLISTSQLRAANDMHSQFTLP